MGLDVRQVIIQQPPVEDLPLADSSHPALYFSQTATWPAQWLPGNVHAFPVWSNTKQRKGDITARYAKYAALYKLYRLSDTIKPAGKTAHAQWAYFVAVLPTGGG